MNIVDTKQKNLHPLLSFEGGEKIPKRVMQTNHAFCRANKKPAVFGRFFIG